MKEFKDYKVIIWWYPYGKHTHSWIHHGFHKAFQYLGYEVSWRENMKENLPWRSEKIIFISAFPEDSLILENFSHNWIIFDHNYTLDIKDHIIPFGILADGFGSYAPNVDEYRHYKRIPKIYWATDLLPSEIEHIPYHYSDTKNVRFIWSWWKDNWLALERARIWCYTHWKNWDQQWKHLFLRYKKFVPEDDIAHLSQKAFLTLSIQWKPQCQTWYIPCRLFKNISYSVLALSNNLFVADLFDDDEVIIEKDIFDLLDKAAKVVNEKRVDEYTKKAIEKVREKHTYINRIQELFTYLQ